MKDSSSTAFDDVIERVDDVLKTIKYVSSTQGVMSRSANVTDSAISIVDRINYQSEKPSKIYSEEEINEFDFEKIQNLIFLQEELPQHPPSTQKPQESFLNELWMAAKGITADAVSPITSFALGKEIPLSPEIIASNYGQTTAGIRQTVSSLKYNRHFLEGAAFVRTATVGPLNLVKYLYSGTELLPNPDWYKDTITYEYVKNNFILPENVTKPYSNFAKIFTAKALRINAAAQAAISFRSKGEYESLVPLVYTTSKLAYSTYVGYTNNEKIRSIGDENRHLKKYIDAKERTNKVLKQNIKLKEILGVEEEELITQNLDAKLSKLYYENPALSSIIPLMEQEYRTNKDKIILINCLQNLVKTNDSLTTEYKLWHQGQTDIPEKKVKVARMHFVRHYKKQFKKYQDSRYLAPNESEIAEAYKSAIKTDFMGTLVDALKTTAGEKGAFEALTTTITSLATATAGSALSEEMKKVKVLEENAILRMEAPSYQLTSPGTYNHEIANIAFKKQVEALALEKMNTQELNGTKEEIIQLYQEKVKEAEHELKSDPLFSDSILFPTPLTKAYDITAGLLNSVSPWGSKQKLPDLAKSKDEIQTVVITSADKIDESQTETSQSVKSGLAYPARTTSASSKITDERHSVEESRGKSNAHDSSSLPSTHSETSVNTSKRKISELVTEELMIDVKSPDSRTSNVFKRMLYKNREVSQRR